MYRKFYRKLIKTISR